MTFKEIQELIKLVNKTNLSELRLEDGDFKIQIRSKEFIKNRAGKNEAPQVISVAQPQAVAPNPQQISAPAQSQEINPVQSEEVETSSDANLIEVKSPIVGTFYRSSSPDKPSFVKVGDSISQGSVVCIVEAMKLFNEIESEVSGKIVKVMVEDASPVQYDQVLFLVEPS